MEISHVLKHTLTVNSVLCEQETDVFSYIKTSNLAEEYIIAVIEHTRLVFPHSRIYLTLYSDPEFDDTYLLVLVRDRSYDQAFLHRLETFVYPKKHEESGEGYLLVNSDFQ